MENEKCCSCHEKSTERSEDEKKKLIHRLNRIEGQIGGIRRMIERDAYCADVLVQSAAVNAAVHAFNKEVLSRHMHSCVVRDIQNGDESAMDELVELLGKLMK